MGNWKFTITGTGCKHNGEPYDADAIAKQCVRALKTFGHNVSDARFYADDKPAYDINVNLSQEELDMLADDLEAESLEPEHEPEHEPADPEP